MSRLLSILAAVLCVGSALASDLDFTLVNDTKRSFEGVYVSASNDKDWDGNLLRDGVVLDAGRRIDVKFEPSAKSAKWDLNVVDDDGVAVSFKGIDLRGVDTVTLKNVDGKITAEVE